MLAAKAFSKLEPSVQTLLQAGDDETDPPALTSRRDNGTSAATANGFRAKMEVYKQQSAANTANDLQSIRSNWKASTK